MVLVHHSNRAISLSLAPVHLTMLHATARTAAAAYTSCRPLPVCLPGTVCAADKARRAAARAASEEEAAGLARQWRNVERSLCSDRGLWAAPHKPEEAAWKLDKHEDSLRRCSS